MMNGQGEKKRCVILGGGGHAGVLIEALRAGGIAEVGMILEKDHSKWGKDLLGVPIFGGDDLLSDMPFYGVTHFLVGLGSTGDTGPRCRLFDLGMAHSLKPLTVKHPWAWCSDSVRVGEGCQLLAGSIVNTGAVLGNNVVVNSHAVIEHECILEDHVHVATGACLASGVHVGKGAHIGIGATIRQLISIGERAIVGAGAVVVRDVPLGSVVVGVPARPLVR